jgi:fatty acid desaturase
MRSTSLIVRRAANDRVRTTMVAQARMVARVGTCGIRDVTCEDLHALRREFIVPPTSALVRQLRSIVRDARDFPLVYLLINVVSTVPAMALALIAVQPSHALGAGYLVTLYGLYLQRFVLALHYSTHSPVFRRQVFIGRALNAVAPLVLAPLFGIPSGVYTLHHAFMHDVEDKRRGKDLSSTAGYQRDSWLGFAAYWARFTTRSFVELPTYAIEKKRYGLAIQCVVGFWATYAAYARVASVNSVAAFWILVAPYIVSSFALTFGNWSQHIFVDPDSPRCDYRLSYCVINHPDNQVTFNDGYHTVHHVNSNVHWSELPEKFIETLEDFAENDGLIFDGVGFFDVGLAVMLGKLDWLADKYVYVGQPTRSKAQIVEMLRYRLQKVRNAKKTM